MDAIRPAAAGLGVPGVRDAGCQIGQCLLHGVFSAHAAAQLEDVHAAVLLVINGVGGGRYVSPEDADEPGIEAARIAG